MDNNGTTAGFGDWSAFNNSVSLDGSFTKTGAGTPLFNPASGQNARLGAGPLDDSQTLPLL
jgi:hypothetical protein